MEFSYFFLFWPWALLSAGSCIRYRSDLEIQQCSIAYESLAAGCYRSVVEKIPVHAAAAIGSAHFLVISQAQTDNTGAVAEIAYKGRLRRDCQRRVEAESKFAKHPRIATGRR